MQAEPSHRPLCMIELIARDRAQRCPGEACAYWEKGCVLGEIEADLDGRPDVAELLLRVRGELEDAQRQDLEDARALFHRRLSSGSE